MSAAIASIRKAQDAARALAARYPNGEKAVKARDVGIAASEIEALLASAIIDVQVEHGYHAATLASLRAALPELEAAAVQEARGNRAPTGLPQSLEKQVRYATAAAIVAKIPA